MPTSHLIRGGFGAPTRVTSAGAARDASTRASVRHGLATPPILTIGRPSAVPSLVQRPARRVVGVAAAAAETAPGAGGAGEEDERQYDPEGPVEAPPPRRAPRKYKFPVPPLYIETTSRVVAIGDLHGDMGQAVRALRLAGVVPRDAKGPADCTWTGGTTHLVQLGDILDRGDDEISLLLLLRKLDQEAQAAGGAVHILNGNHEVANVAGDFRYVTPGAFREAEEFHSSLSSSFGDVILTSFLGVPCDRVEISEDARWAGKKDGEDYARYQKRVELFAPGGPIALQLATHPAVLVVNDTLFAHGGLQMRHVEVGLGALNASLSAWMRGIGVPEDLDEALYHTTGSRDCVVWNRRWGGPTKMQKNYQLRLARRELESLFEGAGREAGCEVKRMVVGHTVQADGANAEWDNKVWRMDVGCSRGVSGAAPEVLEIPAPGEEPVVLRFPPGEDGALPLLGMQQDSDESGVDTAFEPRSCSLFDHGLLLRSEIDLGA